MTHQNITVSTLIPKQVACVWDCWTKPEHIIHWNFASEDWHCPSATNDLFVEGRFSWRMEAKDGSFGFDFTGRYTNIVEHQLIEYRLDDDRFVSVQFIERAEGVELVETFEAESENSIELQTMGWQAILDNFKEYCLID